MQWPEILGIKATSRHYALMLKFYGLKSMEELNGSKGKAIRADLDMLGLMSKDDCPLYVFNKMRGGTSLTQGHINHHPLHALALKERSLEVGLEAQVYAPAIGLKPPEEKQESLIDFILRHLGAEGND
jgi:hypothetical protein